MQEGKLTEVNAVHLSNALLFMLDTKGKLIEVNESHP